MVSEGLNFTSSEDSEEKPSRIYDEHDGDIMIDGTSQPDGFVARALYHLNRHWKILVLGQLMSLLLASGGATQATLHVECGLSAPTFTMAMAYLIQGAINWFMLVTRQRKERREQRQYAHDTHQVLLVDQQRYAFFHIQLHRPVWQYVVMSFLDAQANALTMLAFRYTTLTSVTLLDALAIPSAVLLSKTFLNRRYTCLHFVGLFACMVGIVFNVVQDTEADLEQEHTQGTKTAEQLEYPHKLWGDVLAACGGVLYGLNDVLAEATVRSQNSIVEFLAMVGLFGFLFSIFQALIFERDDILEFFGRDPDAVSTCSISKGWFLYTTFVGITVIGYIGGTRFLMISEAAFFNLSLLTGDLWCVAFSVFAENIIPRPLFFVALLFVMSGVVLYEMAPHPVVEDTHVMRTTAQQLAEIDHDFELQGARGDDDEGGVGNNDEDDEDDDMELL